MGDYLTEIREKLRDTLSIGRDLDNGEYLRPLAEIASCLVGIYTRNLETGTSNKLVVFGNGGSCQQASHLTMELIGRFKRMPRRSLPAIALSDSVGLTAIANDLSYENVFARQVEGMVNPGDVAIGITTSGKSPNVIYGLLAAKQKGAVTAAFTGRYGILLSDVILPFGLKPDHCFSVPSEETSLIQEYHLFGIHRLCDIVDREIFALEEKHK